MNIKLIRERCSLYGDDSWMDSYNFIDKETDYTGRWKIVNTNGCCTLYIECFELVEEEYTQPVTLFKDRIRGFLWWKETYQDNIKVDMKKTRVRANVNWVPDYSLELRVTEEFINECTCEGLE